MGILEQDISKEWQKHLDKQAQEAHEGYRDELIAATGMSQERADRIAEIHPSAKLVEDGVEDHALLKAREEYRDALLSTGTCKTREDANRMAGITE
jgi:rhamnogalacturonyl hydrolase YesR